MNEYIEIYNRDYNKNVKNFIAIVYNLKRKVITAENFNIFSFRQIIYELILECNSNKLKIKRNITLFSEMLNNIKEKGYLLNQKFKSNINLLLGKLNSQNPELVLSICIELKKELETKLYFDYLVDNLNQYLKDDMANNYMIIKEITENIFIELINKGYSSKNISEILLRLFSNSNCNENDNSCPFPNTSFPINLIKEKYEKKELNVYINNLTIYNRIDYIKELYITEKSIYYLIIPVSGITISEKKLQCNNDIFFYNPNISEPFETIIEKFKHDKFNEVDYTNCANACVKIKAYNADDAYNQGIKKLNNYINILKVISSLNNYKIVEEHSAILNKQKKIIQTSYSAFNNEYDWRKFEREIRPINEKKILDDKKTKELSEKLEDLIYFDEEKKNKTILLLINSIRKFSEAIDSNNEQEVFLKYWSALESLFDESLLLNTNDNKIEIIKEIVPAYLVYITKYEPLHNLYHKLEIATNRFTYNFKNRNKQAIIKLSQKSLKKIYLDNSIKKRAVSLESLIDNCDEIIKKVNDYYYLSSITDIKQLFTDCKFAVTKLNQKKKFYENSIVIIYRIRNQIIHDAYCNEITIKFYLPLLKKIVNCFLNSIIDEYIENKSLTMNEIVNRIYTKSILFMDDSKQNDLQSLLFN